MKISSKLTLDAAAVAALFLELWKKRGEPLQLLGDLGDLGRLREHDLLLGAGRERKLREAAVRVQQTLQLAIWRGRGVQGGEAGEKEKERKITR